MLADNEFFDSQIKVVYRKLPASGEVFWPIIDISLAGFYQPIIALVDSGASHSILHEDVARTLDIKPKYGKQLLTGLSASGSYKYWETEPVKVEIYGRKFSFNFKVINENKGLIWPCILGHDTLFKIAKLEFRTFKEYFKVFFRTDIN